MRLAASLSEQVLPPPNHPAARWQWLREVQIRVRSSHLEGFQDSRIRYPLPDQSTALTTKTIIIYTIAQVMLSSIKLKY